MGGGWGYTKDSINTSDKIHDNQLIMTIVAIHLANCMYSKEALTSQYYAQSFLTHTQHKE